MENLISLKTIKKSEKMLKGRVFTDLQLNILKKKLQKKHLNSNEKTYYYRYIKPKIRAMLSLFDINSSNIKGKEYIIEKRIPKAINILNYFNNKHKNQKIMISGSFLFNKNYNDIDIFIFTKYNKEDYKKGKMHINFVSESALDSLFFNSLSNISISNFSYIISNKFEIKIEDVLQNYELLINHILNKEDYQRELRNFLLETEYISKEVVLNPKQLYYARKKLMEKDIIKIASNILSNSLIFGYHKKSLKQKLKLQITNYKKLLKSYKKSKNLNIYLKTYRQVIKFAT